MSREALLAMALSAAAGGLLAQAAPAPRPAAPPGPAGTPAQGPAVQPQSAPGVPGAPGTLAQPDVQLPTDTTLPAPHTIGWMRVGQTRAGNLQDGDFRMGDGTWADVWYFEGAAGQHVVIDLKSSAFNAYLQLLDAAGNKIAEDTDGGGGRDARITFTLREAGRYQVVVNNETDDVKTGPYTLSLH